MRANRNKVDSANSTQVLSRFPGRLEGPWVESGLARIFAESMQLSKEGVFVSKMAIRATCGWIMVHIKKTHTAPATARSACCTCGVSTKLRSLLLGQGKAASSAGWGPVRSQKGGTSAHIRRPRPPPPWAPPRLVALQLAGLLQCRGALLARSLALLLPAPSRRRRRAAAAQAGLGLANTARRMRRDAALDRCFGVLQCGFGVEELT